MKSKNYLSMFTSVMIFVFLLVMTQPVEASCIIQAAAVSFNLSIAYLITTMISFILLLSYVTFVKKREILFVFLYSAVFIVNVGYAFLAASTSLSEALLANKISYLGAVFLPFFMFLIVAEESHIKLPRWFILCLIICSTFVFFLTASPGYSTLYYEKVGLVRSAIGTYLVKEYGPLHLLYYLYLFVYFIGIAITILYSYYTKKNKSLKLVLHLFACLSCNIFVWFLGQVFHFQFEFLSVSYIVTETYLLSLYNMMEDFYEKEQTYTEQPMVTMIIDSNNDESSSLYEADGSISIEEIIRYWPQVSHLTPREIEVFQLLIQNKKRKDIADELCVSENTIKKHTSNIFSKLNITNRTEIIQQISKIK